MASFSVSIQVVLISTSVLCIALLMKFSVPLVLDFSVSQAPHIWGSLSSWLKPPYLYVVINCIIITIAASSRYHRDHDYDEASIHDEEERMPNSKVILSHRSDEFERQSAAVDVACDWKEEKCGVLEEVSASVEALRDEEEEEDEFVISKSTWIPPKRTNSYENLSTPATFSPAEKPLVSSRFCHRKPLKASPEGGRALRRVSKPKRQETLENTWKMITEGRPMPLTRHLKKSDTWENHGRQVCAVDQRLVKKSETFRDRTNEQLAPVSSSSPMSGKLRKEPSLSQDELNRRVEAFIKKFNEEMRLQRQESLNQYKEMIGVGSQLG
ncbi:hypothetical protein K2173_001663 [Erythroxylum novogranatense]|uniref:DUF4408 domain-containing protein n=1 Tax=Erythroxylum novogranatense TaxID=1862640 RepID=A0AAV8T5Q7_9ROSI|nr:hypothetical protein K2173_001663 [Erythroxylum novogranatense]